MKIKPKVLICIDWYYPSYKAGGPIQSIKNFVLAMQHHLEIYVFTSNCDFDSVNLNCTPINQWTTGIANEQVYYCSNDVYAKSLLKGIITTVNPSVIYINSMFSVKYAINPLFAASSINYTGSIILAPRGMLQLGALQFKKLKKVIFLKALQLTKITSNIHFQATDAQEVDDIKKNIKYYKNITQLTNFAITPAQYITPIVKDVGTLKLIFISRIVPKKNLLSLLQVLKQLQVAGSITLSIYGDVGDALYWQQCKQLMLLMPHNIVVTYYGAINNNDVAATIVQHHLFVLPTLGENFGHAIFEAFANARPVLISTHTPWRNLPQLQAGWDVNITTTQPMHNVITTMLTMHQSAYNTLCQGSLKVASTYSNNAHLQLEYLTLFN